MRWILTSDPWFKFPSVHEVIFHYLFEIIFNENIKWNNNKCQSQAFKCWTVSLSTQILILTIAPLSFISGINLCESAILPDLYLHFTVPSGRRGALFFLKGLMYTYRSTFVRKTKPFFCHYISMPRWHISKTKTRLQDNCFVTGPPSVDF